MLGVQWGKQHGWGSCLYKAYSLVGDVLIFYCFVTDNHKIRSWKYTHFYVIPSVGPESGPSLAGSSAESHKFAVNNVHWVVASSRKNLLLSSLSLLEEFTCLPWRDCGRGFGWLSAGFRPQVSWCYPSDYSCQLGAPCSSLTPGLDGQSPHQAIKESL